jgi:hypothetical protein
VSICIVFLWDDPDATCGMLACVAVSNVVWEGWYQLCNVDRVVGNLAKEPFEIVEDGSEVWRQFDPPAFAVFHCRPDYSEETAASRDAGCCVM